MGKLVWFKSDNSNNWKAVTDYTSSGQTILTLMEIPFILFINFIISDILLIPNIFCLSLISFLYI